MKSVVVTGGAGFIGSHLCEYLLSGGDKVFCIDSFLTGRRENIKHLLKSKSFQLIEHDVVNPIRITTLKIDQIYNLASPASPDKYQKYPLETIKTNTIGIINVLDFALKVKARVLQASTSEVYGDPLEHPQEESYRGNVNPIGIRACYDEGKRISETLFFEYHRQFRLDVRVTRIFNTFGPRMESSDGRVVSNFITQALSNKPLTVYGDGQDTRSFCYVTDMVSGLYKLMNTDNFTGPVNLGNPQEMKIVDLAKTVIKLTGSRSKFVFLPPQEDSPHKRKPDITLAQKKLVWQPKVGLAAGLKKTIEYFKK